MNSDTDNPYTKWTHLIFDLGETLLDFSLNNKWFKILEEKAIPLMYKQILSDVSEENIIPFSITDFSSIAFKTIARRSNPQSFRDRVKEYFTHLNIPIQPHLIENQVKCWVKSIKPYPVLYQDSIPFLSDLSQSGNYVLSLWSDTPFQTPGIYIEEFMIQHHIRLFFDTVFFSGDHELRKPDPQTLEIIHDHYQIPKSQMVYIGNAVKDVQTGINFGIDTIWINRNQEDINETGVHPTHEVINLSDLLPILFKP